MPMNGWSVPPQRSSVSLASLEGPDVHEALQAKEKLSIEMAARKARHQFLAKTARAHRFKTVALAHQADDQVELFFIRLFRGSGTDALAGMAPTSVSSETQALP